MKKSALTSSQRLLRDLIAIPSVNPAFLPENDPRAGEEGMSDYLAAIAARGGLEVELRDVLPNRGNLLAVLPPRGKARKRVLLAPHLDTVGEPDMPTRMFEPAIRHDRMHGRGACDTKGCVAAMLVALMEVANSSDRPDETEIVFLGLVDEEHGQCGSRTFAADKYKADLAIVGEPTRLKVVTAHKGNLWLQLKTTGKMAHGARPELGKNAVHEMAKVVHALETEYARELKKKRHPLLGSATSSVGTICGGTQPNIVPNQCVISVDRRTVPGETDAAVFREIAGFLRKRKLKAEVSSLKGAPCRPLLTDPKQELVASLLKIARQTAPVGVDFFCDAAILAEGGIPSVVFGPGDIAQAHTSDEWISLTSLERGTQLLKRYLQTLP